ncbi:hypothetical protein I546_3016 [Mycobacterium kansasii 732]|nr:hypothetical protein I546_3016 [Mycobacterium kansasii 732]
MPAFATGHPGARRPRFPFRILIGHSHVNQGIRSRGCRRSSACTEGFERELRALSVS